MTLSKEPTFLVAVFATVGCGLIGGLLFAFSNFVMKALSKQPPENGIRTMQAINVYILNPLFLSIFLGTALAVSILAVTAIFHRSSPGMLCLLVGSGFYLLGVFGVTMAFNVPLNNRLEAYDPETAEAARYWLTYVSQWMRWNHVRTVASLLATVFFVLAIRQAHSSLE